MTPTLPQLLTKLRELKPELATLFGVSAVAVFGSYARGEAGPGSDLDLIIDFSADARPTYFALARMDALLTGALGVSVQSTPRDGLNPRLEPYIRSDLVSA